MSYNVEDNFSEEIITNPSDLGDYIDKLLII